MTLRGSNALLDADGASIVIHAEPRRLHHRSGRQLRRAHRLRRHRSATEQMQIADFALERYFARWEFAVRHVLCASDVEPLALARAARARRRRRASALGVAAPRLHRIARPAGAARRDRVALSRARPPTTSSRSPAPRKASSSRCTRCSRAGDHAVVVWPAYQSLHEVARVDRRDVTLVPLDPRDWSLDVDAVAAAMRPNTRVVVINFPHSPTGAQTRPPISSRDSSSIAELHGAHLFSDEVYRFLEHDAPTAARRGRDRSPRARQPRRDVEGVRARRHSHRLDRDARRGAARANRGAQGLHDDLQRAPSEILALIALRARDAVLDALDRHRRGEPRSARRRSSRATPNVLAGCGRAPAACAFPS